MQPLPLALLREPRVWIEGDAGLMSALQQSRDKELFELRLTDSVGRLTAPLAVVAKAVRGAEVGGATDSAPIGRIAAACLATLTPPARPEPRLLVPDLQGMVVRHHDAQVRRDELTRLSAREDRAPTDGRLSARVTGASSIHKPRRRTDPLAAVLAEAKQQALDPTDWPSAWAALVNLAEQPLRPAPLMGYVEEEGVQYRTDDAEQPVAYLTRAAFRKRFARG